MYVLGRSVTNAQVGFSSLTYVHAASSASFFDATATKKEVKWRSDSKGQVKKMRSQYSAMMKSNWTYNTTQICFLRQQLVHM